MVGRLVHGVVVVGLLAAGLVVVQVATPLGARSLSSAEASITTGTGGQFVSVSGHLLDTRYNVGGYSTAMPAGTWRTVQVNGQAGLPTTGIAAVQVTLTTVNPVATGLVHVGPSGSPSSYTALFYNSAGFWSD